LIWGLQVGLHIGRRKSGGSEESRVDYDASNDEVCRTDFGNSIPDVFLTCPYACGYVCQHERKFVLIFFLLLYMQCMGQLDLTKAELGRMKLRNLLSNANAHLVAMVRRQRGAAPVHNADPEKEQDASLQFISHESGGSSPEEQGWLPNPKKFLPAKAPEPVPTMRKARVSVRARSKAPLVLVVLLNDETEML
jgi:hypothetical protein